MVPAHAAIQFQPVLLLIVQVDTGHLCGSQSLSPATKAATAATGESHVIDIVGTGQREYLQVVLHPSCKHTAAIALLCTGSQVGVQHETFVHAALDAEVEHRFLLTVVDTAHTSQVTLLVVGFHALHDTGGQILQGRLRVARHELLAVHHDFLHLLTVDGDLSVVVHLGTGQFSHQFFHHRAFRRAIGRRVIYKSVCLDGHLGSLTRHHGTLQHDGIGLQGDGSKSHVLLSRNIDFLGV